MVTTVTGPGRSTRSVELAADGVRGRGFVGGYVSIGHSGILPSPTPERLGPVRPTVPAIVTVDGDYRREAES